MVKPAGRKEIVQYLVEHGWLSERKACQLIGISRTGMRYQSQRGFTDQKLKERLLELAKQYPRYGYLMFHAWSSIENVPIEFVQNKVYR